MLPLTVQFLVAMLAYGLNERMARKADYLREENRVLKEALKAGTGKAQIPLANEQRRRLATKGKALTPAEREECCQIVRPSTILDWFRKLVARYTKIRDALRGVKVEIGRTTVANILAEAGIEPAPERNRKRTWKHFLRCHWETLYACDFFAVETLGVFGTVRYMVFFVMELQSRAVHVAGIRIDPDGAWMMQIARSLLCPLSHRSIPPRARWPTHQAKCLSEQRQRDGRTDPVPLTPWWTAQLLRSGGGVTGCHGYWDTTGSPQPWRPKRAPSRRARH
jgi:hypothetical protein